MDSIINRYFEKFGELPPFGEGLSIELLQRSISLGKKIVRKPVKNDPLTINEGEFELSR
jgi:hypothetical protein